MRRKLDQYFTPETATKALLFYGPPIAGTVLECCSGQNDIARILERSPLITDVRTNDIDPAMPSQEHWDATQVQNWGQPDWIVSNPPFSVAAPVVRNAFAAARVGVAMLLRLSFLEPCKDRSDFLSDNPPDIVSVPRISFTGDGKTDNVSTAWFIWSKLYGCELGVRVITKEQMAKLSGYLS